MFEGANVKPMTVEDPNNDGYFLREANLSFAFDSVGWNKDQFKTIPGKVTDHGTLTAKKDFILYEYIDFNVLFPGFKGDLGSAAPRQMIWHF